MWSVKAYLGIMRGCCLVVVYLAEFCFQYESYRHRNRQVQDNVSGLVRIGLSRSLIVLGGI
jgi:hypothetical protein